MYCSVLHCVQRQDGIEECTGADWHLHVVIKASQTGHIVVRCLVLEKSLGEPLESSCVGKVGKIIYIRALNRGWQTRVELHVQRSRRIGQSNGWIFN